jgi:DNA-binding transcriptional MerR regulator
MTKLFYTVGEVAGILNESTSLVRFWANEFPKFIRPQRNAKGNRLFSQEDVDNFRKIHHFVKTEGLTLEGAAKRLREERKGGMDKQKVLQTLKGIRQQLSEIRAEL